MGYIQGRFDHDWYNAKRPIRSLLFSGVASGVWARSKIDRTNTAAIAGTPPLNKCNSGYTEYRHFTIQTLPGQEGTLRTFI